MTALIYHKPADPVAFLEECLAKARSSKDNTYSWDTFHKEEDNSPSLASLMTPELNDVKNLKSHPSSTEDGLSKTESCEEDKLKRVVGKPVIFVLG